MEVRAANFERALEDISAALREASYVAVDLELTGVSFFWEPDSYADRACERLEKACRIAESFAPVQLGITICSEAHKLSSYNIIVSPESAFLCETSAVKFLLDHKVDLNSWVDEGVRFASIEDLAEPADPDLRTFLRSRARSCKNPVLCEASRLRLARQDSLDLNAWAGDHSWLRQGAVHALSEPSAGFDPEELEKRRRGLPRLWQALKDARKPLVVHGYMDVLFLLAAFEKRALPRDPRNLAGLVMSCFPGGAYDTCLLRDVIKDLRTCRLGLQPFLEAARQDAGREAGERPRLDLAEETRRRYGESVLGEGEDLAHEAGYDSLLTAQLFESLCAKHGQAVEESVNRFYLHKSTECLALGNASLGKRLGARVFDPDKLVVASLLTDDAVQNTAFRIQEAKRLLGIPIFYRKIEDNTILVPDCTTDTLRLLSSRMPGVQWRSFYEWQKHARQGGEQKPDTGRYAGIIKSFFWDKGFGFIRCPGLQTDVFLHELQLGSFQQGNLVTFSVVYNNNGLPQAREVDDRISGTIRSFNMDTGYGFIDCPEAHQLYNRDIYLSRAHLGNLCIGQRVIFSIVLNKQGKPQASNVQAAEASERQEKQGHSLGSWFGLKDRQSLAAESGGAGAGLSDVAPTATRPLRPAPTYPPGVLRPAPNFPPGVLSASRHCREPAGANASLSSEMGRGLPGPQVTHPAAEASEWSSVDESDLSAHGGRDENRHAELDPACDQLHRAQASSECAAVTVC